MKFVIVQINLFSDLNALNTVIKCIRRQNLLFSVGKDPSKRVASAEFTELRT